MDLLQLKYFCHAASTQNFAKTAKAFSVPASTISISIRRLETELSAPLFTRSANRVKLNPQGELFYVGVKEALELLDRSAAAVQSNTASNQLKVGILLNRHFVTQCIRQFREQYPGVDVAYNKISLGQSIEAFDTVIGDDSLEDENFTREHVFRDKIVLVSAKGLLSFGGAPLAEVLKNQTFVSVPSGTTMYRDTIRIFNTLGINPQIVVPEGDSSFFLPRYVEEGRGVVLIPRKTPWVSFVEERLDIREIGDYYRNTYIYFKKHNTSPHAARFNSFLLDAYHSNYSLE